MNDLYVAIIVAAGIVIWGLIIASIFASRYTKVGPNEVLVVSGRKVRLPDGRFVGCRFVKSGGTFVFPVIERADVLSLEVMPVEMPRSRAQVSDGRAVEADCIAQVKINGDDASIIAAAEHFLTKNQIEIKNVVRPVLEKHLSGVLASSSLEEANQNPAACAARLETSAAEELGKRGLSLVGFTIRNIHTV